MIASILFGIAFAEALYFGNVLVGHDGMSAYGDLSANGKYGTYFADNDAESFAEALTEAIAMSQKPGMPKAIELHAAENFYWSGLVKEIAERLGELKN